MTRSFMRHWLQSIKLISSFSFSNFCRSVNSQSLILNSCSHNCRFDFVSSSCKRSSCTLLNRYNDFVIYRGQITFWNASTSCCLVLHRFKNSNIFLLLLQRRLNMLSRCWRNSINIFFIFEANELLILSIILLIFSDDSWHNIGDVMGVGERKHCIYLIDFRIEMRLKQNNLFAGAAVPSTPDLIYNFWFLQLNGNVSKLRNDLNLFDEILCMNWNSGIKWIADRRFNFEYLTTSITKILPYARDFKISTSKFQGDLICVVTIFNASWDYFEIPQINEWNHVKMENFVCIFCLFQI